MARRPGPREACWISLTILLVLFIIAIIRLL
jgi:hypothetical protein